MNSPRTTRFRDLRLVIGLVSLAAVAVVAAGGIALARDDQTARTSEASTVDCPDVVGVLPEVPEAAAEDVASELAALEAQVSAANDRLVSSQGEGGPNFVDNAILGPLADKRFATLERIEISIGRHGERPRGLTALAECGLADGEAGSGAEDSGDQADTGDQGNGQGNGNDAAGGNGNGGAGVDNGAGDNGAGGNGAGENDPPAGGVQTVSCPDVVGVLPEVPEAAAEDVASELAALEAQVSAANDQLVSSQGEGGPDFVDNAILGPLADKRFATLERIEISIGRHGERPRGLTALAECGLADGEAGSGAEDSGDQADTGDQGNGQGNGNDAAGGNGNGGAGVDNGAGDNGAGDNGAGENDPPAGGVQTVSCPDVVGVLPEVPAAAAEDVASELAALEAQVSAANDQLVSSQGEGGPDFVDNAILGPLADKRFATLERIEISIGRHGERPRGLTALAECDLS